MGPQLEYLETILTCKGNFYAPDFSSHLDDLKCRLQELVFQDDSKKLVVKKVEPWNSVRVTLRMPVDAAQKLKRLAEQRDRMLHEIGVLEVQIEGDRIISLAIDGSKSEGLERSTESGKKSEIVIDVPPCRSGQSVPSKETLKPFANLPHPTNIEWPIFTKILNSIDKSSVKVTLPHSSGDIQVQVNYSKADQRLSGTSTKVSSHQNSTNISETCNITQNASSPFEMTSQVSRTWIQGEERFLNCQNIASSSPLLVNLLKSPGSRTQTNSSLLARPQAPCELSSEVAQQAQKRKRSQTRKSKRLKEGIECSNVSGHSPFQSIPTSHSTFQREMSRTSLNALSQTSISESQQMINPYTGDLELIEECEEPSNSNSSDVMNNFIEPIPSESSLIPDVDADPIKTLESNSNISESRNHVSSHSSVVSSCLVGGALRQSPCSNASPNVSSRSNTETSTPATFNPSIPVFSMHSQWSVNMNIPHTFVSPIPTSLSENGLLLNHALSSCYMQNMLKALTSESAKFIASQSLVFPSAGSQVQEDSKSIIDANSLARIIVQSSLLPKSLDSMKSTCPLSVDSKASMYRPCSNPVSTNGQMPKQMMCNSMSSTYLNNIVPLDNSKIQLQNDVIVKEGVPQQLNKKLVNPQAHLKLNNMVTSTQASQLMKEMFPCLSLPVFSSTASFPMAPAAYNGHVSSPHRDQMSTKTPPNEFMKTASSYSSDCRTINGYNSPLGQISAINDIHKHLTMSTIPFSLSSSSNLLDCDGVPSSTHISSKSLSYRKQNKNLEDSLPTKSKANLTVAQLLEQVEIAKNHMTFSSCTALKNNMNEAPLVYMTANVGSTKISNSKSDARNEIVSQIQKNAPSPQCNFGSSQKLLAYTNPMPFNVLDSVPMPITSPGYPHNLTESVQKAMQGVGFDNSPSTSPPPARQPASLNCSIEGPTSLSDDKSRVPASADMDKEESVGLADLDILGNQFEFGQLEEALKSSLKGQESEGSCADNQKHLIDLDSADLDFVFNAEDENQLESLIALKDYDDDIEKLAETLASNIDGGDIDEEILISEKELETFDQNNVYRASKSNSSLPSKTPPNACTSFESDADHRASDILDPQHHTEDKTNPCLENEDYVKACHVDESADKQILADTNLCPADSDISIERIRCKSSNLTKRCSGSGMEPGIEATAQSASSRMATRSSNKQKCQIASGFTSSPAIDSKAEAETQDPKDIQKNNQETTLQPLLRRSNRTIKKTEIAVESLQAKAAERSKRSKDESGDNKLNPLSSVRTEHSTKSFRQKSSLKRKYSSKSGSINENNANNDVQKDHSSIKRIACNNTSTAPGPLESNVMETDFILCSKRPKTS